MTEERFSGGGDALLLLSLALYLSPTFVATVYGVEEQEKSKCLKAFKAVAKYV